MPLTGPELACSLVQEKLRTLQPTYLANVPDTEHYPTAMDDALCPFAFTWSGAGSWYQKGHGYKVDIRTLKIFIIIESLAQRDIPSRTVQGMRIQHAIVNLFTDPANIPLDNGTTSGYQITVESAEGNPQSDSGLRSDLPFSGKPWFHFTVDLKVRIMWQ